VAITAVWAVLARRICYFALAQMELFAATVRPEERLMNPKSTTAVVAIAISAICLPLCAQAQQKSTPKVTKADAQKVINIISGDKAKTKLYCDIAALGEQIDAAAQKKDEKKIDELSQKADEMGTKIGPEYVALMDGLQELDEKSKDGEEIGTMLESLDKLCTK